MFTIVCKYVWPRKDIQEFEVLFEVEDRLTRFAFIFLSG
jgi:hypothetical protein